jgi:hypothetical protein
LLCLTLSVTSACVTGSTGGVQSNSYCAIAKPISYDGARDTPETVNQIEGHNSRWVCLCEQDCPAQP